MLAILVGASTIGSEKSKLLEIINNSEENKLVIAVDGGIRFFVEEKINPDVWIGDMDSAAEYGIDKDNPLITGPDMQVLSPIKDDTDMDMAVKHAIKENCDDILIFGGLGGRRESHSFANAQMLYRYAKQGVRITMAAEKTKMFVLCDGHIILPEIKDCYVSIIALTDIAKNVIIRGLFYPYEGNLTNEFALGVSNEFIGREAYISVERGALLIILEEK